RRVIIVGGGASGVLLAAHLLRRGASDIEVLLIEREPEVGKGLAYSTDHPHHLLNVRAANMSAFADEPDHLIKWLAKAEHASGISDHSFFFIE
ncbi:FAD-dependent oxidoreductase, partial [Acinetobacter baumannii]